MTVSDTYRRPAPRPGIAHVGSSRRPIHARWSDPDACPLTQAELRALSLLIEGRSYSEIAEAVGRQPSTIRSQLQSAYRRLGVGTSYQAVLVCVRRGWLAWPGEDAGEAAIRRVADVFQRLIAAVEQRTDEEDGELTDRQRDYLRAFEVQLRAHDPARRMSSRAGTTRALAGVLEEAGLSRTTGPRRGDLLGMLESIADRSDRARRR